MTLEDIEKLIGQNADPKAIFGSDVDATLKRLRLICHPDRHAGQEARAEAAFTALGLLAERAKAPPVLVKSPKRTYRIVSPLGIGDVSDVHHAVADGKDYVLKMARVPDGAAVLDTERAAIAAILTEAGDTHYRKYFPTLVESFPVRDRFPKRVNVFTHEAGSYTLERVRARHPDGLDGRHLAWVFKRLLTAIGFAHRCGRVHGAIVPSHILIFPDDHRLELIGWGHSVEMAGTIRTVPGKYLDWYPPEVRKKQAAHAATDLYLAAKSVIFLGGGAAPCWRLPHSVPRGLRLFLASCLLESPAMRPRDAWRLLDEFEAVLRGLYGPPRFHVLSMS